MGGLGSEKSRGWVQIFTSVWDFGVREESIPKTSALIDHIYS
jgi:hypothetical protein